MSNQEKDLFIDKSAAALDEESRKIKKTKDYLPEIQQVLPTILAPWEADHSKYADTIAALLPWEKKARLVSDAPSTQLVATTIIKICADSKQYDLLREQLTYLTKARAQLIAVIKAVVVKALDVAKALDDNQPEKLEMLTTIITLSDGKLCVEYEGAISASYKSKLLESQGKTREAYDAIIAVPVEIVGSMSYEEKTEMLLEQTRLAILSEEYLKAQLTIKKVREKELDKWPRLKHAYYYLQSKLHMHHKNYLDASRAYYQLFLLHQSDKTKLSDTTTTTTTTVTPSGEDMGDDDITASATTIASTESDWISWLQRAILTAILAPHDYESLQLRKLIVNQAQHVVKCGVFETLLLAFNSQQLITWPLPIPGDITQTTGIESLAQAITQDKELGISTTDADEENSSSLWFLLRRRFIQHNLYLISTIFTRITIPRAAEILHLDEARVEREVCLVGKDLGVKIDRRTREMHFQPESTGLDALQEWSSDVEQLFKLVETTTQLIHKERIAVTNRSTVPTSISP